MPSPQLEERSGHGFRPEDALAVGADEVLAGVELVGVDLAGHVLHAGLPVGSAGEIEKERRLSHPVAHDDGNATRSLRLDRLGGEAHSPPNQADSFDLLRAILQGSLELKLQLHCMRIERLSIDQNLGSLS